MPSTRGRAHVFRQYEVIPADAGDVGREAVASARARHAAAVGCEAWAVHLSQDRRRVMTVESWRDTEAFVHGGRGDLPSRPVDTAAYRLAGTGGVEPLAAADPGAGVITIDVFRVWRPLVGAVSAINLRNGAAFDRQPGCLGTTVLAGVTAGRIATYARWRRIEDFLAAFATVGGAEVAGLDELNTAAARRTLGLIRPDYHAYELLDAHPGAPR